MTSTEKLHRRLNALILIDTRPTADQDAISRHTGHKRSTIKAAATGAAPVLQLVETLVANMGTTTKGTLLTTPIDPSQIHQLAGTGKGLGATCWVLGPILTIALHSPATLLNNFVQIDSENVLVLGIWQGIPVAIHMTLEVSTAYNQGTDVRPELVLKAMALLRAATWKTGTGADMANDDYGSAGTTLTMLLGTPAMNSLPNLDRDGASLAAGKVVCLVSNTLAPANAPGWYVVNHVFVPRSIGGGQCVMEQPWFGGTDFIVPQAQYEDPKFFYLAMTAAIPATPIVSAAAFGIAVATQSLPVTPSPQVSTMKLSPLIVLDLKSAVVDSGIRLETRGGRPDLGYCPDTEGGTIKFPVTIPAAGTYVIGGSYSSLGNVSLTATIGAQSSNATLSPTGSWDIPTPLALTDVVLPSGPQTLTIVHHAGPQANFFDGLYLVKVG